MLKPQKLEPIPEETLKVGQEILEPENLMRKIGEQYGELVKDEDFLSMYPKIGQPALSPALLALVSILQAQEHLSDRMAVRMVVTRIDWKYALHLPLCYKGFDASVLSEFRDRLISNKAERVIFDKVLEKMKAEDLLKGRAVQRTDSLMILSAVRKLNRLELVMETMRLALEEIAKEDIKFFQANIEKTWIETYAQRACSERIIKESGAKAETETQRLLVETGKNGFELIKILEQSETELQNLEKVVLLKKVWSQQYQIKENIISTTELAELAEPAEPAKILNGDSKKKEQTAKEKDIELTTSESRAKAKIKEMIESPHDEETRYTQKKGKEYRGYKLQLTEVASEEEVAIITDVEIVSASEYDGESLPNIHERLKEREILPETHLVDTGYVSGDAIVESRERGVELLGLIASNTTMTARENEGFSVENFQIDFENKQAICPNGNKQRAFSETVDGRGRKVFQILWNKEICQSCPFKDKCIQGKKLGRTIKISRNYKVIQQRRIEQKTDDFHNRYRRRAGVEATFSHLVCCMDARQTPYQGKNKTQLHFLLLAAGLNIKRAVYWQNGLRPLRKRSSRLEKISLAYFVNFQLGSFSYVFLLYCEVTFDFASSNLKVTAGEVCKLLKIIFSLA